MKITKEQVLTMIKTQAINLFKVNKHTTKGQFKKDVELAYKQVNELIKGLTKGNLTIAKVMNNKGVN